MSEKSQPMPDEYSNAFQVMQKFTDCYCGYDQIRRLTVNFELSIEPTRSRQEFLSSSDKTGEMGIGKFVNFPTRESVTIGNA